MKIIVAGSRDFNDYEQLAKTLDTILPQHSDIEIVSGNARGADSLGEKYAATNGIRLKKFPAEWSKYGKQAGYIRNQDMAKYSDMLVAFWDNKSKGTKHMINLAKKCGLETIVCNSDNTNILF